MFSFSESGSLSNILSFLKSAQNLNKRMASRFDSYGKQGAAALAAATPVRSGLASSSWGYYVKQDKESVTIAWTNSDVENGFPVVIALQYGYATGTGGYVQGRDFINPALKPIFDKISADVGKEVSVL